MGMGVTAGLAAVFLIVAIISGWRGARAARPLSAPRLVPWRFVMLVCLTILLALLAHMVGLLHTNTPSA
jgi:uncharacterized membrane protein YsdA (DUF1294 family)